MLGSSRESLTALRASLDARPAAVLPAVAADLFAVGGLLAAQQTLRSTLADSGIPVARRAAVVTELLGAALSADGLAMLQEVVAARWSDDADLVEAVEGLAAQAVLADAADHGVLDRVEEELFRFSRAVEASPELQLALTDPALPAEGKAAIVTDLIGAHAAPATTTLLAHTVAHLHGRAPVAAVSALADLAAAQRHRVRAEVRSAVPLTDEQHARLAAVLERLTGHKVTLQVEVTPDVLGGLLVRVGDEVIDGSIATRLEQARRAISA